jgi:hypothetical protein
MVGYCATGQSPQRAVVTMEEEEPRAELFHADRWTDGQVDMTNMTKLIVSFRKSAQAPKYCFESASFVLGYSKLQKI